jgi:flagellar hook-basal body complex protein FliE
MRIDGIGSGFNASPVGQVQSKPVEGGGFGETIKKAIGDVNELQTSADQVTNKLATGDAVEIHQAMIAMQKASTALQFTIQVRNRIIEAYQEVMRMQV